MQAVAHYIASDAWKSAELPPYVGPEAQKNSEKSVRDTTFVFVISLMIMKDRLIDFGYVGTEEEIFACMFFL